MADSQNREIPTLQDEIDLVLRHCGVTTPDLDRLARKASDMQHIEWELFRRAHRGQDQSGSANQP